MLGVFILGETWTHPAINSRTSKQNKMVQTLWKQQSGYRREKRSKSHDPKMSPMLLGLRTYSTMEKTSFQMKFRTLVKHCRLWAWISSAFAGRSQSIPDRVSVIKGWSLSTTSEICFPGFSPQCLIFLLAIFDLGWYVLWPLSYNREKACNCL